MPEENSWIIIIIINIISISISISYSIIIDQTNHRLQIVFLQNKTGAGVSENVPRCLFPA